ncbi:type II secretion system F family protein [Geminicoccaceae bacterium 1502E]|nr:type II secretion system F family protein [Geminicoccaceae bacterium 1502E]
MMLTDFEALGPEEMLSLLAGAAALASTLAVWGALIDRDHGETRRRAVAQRARELRVQAAPPTRKRLQPRRMLPHLVTMLRLAHASQDERLREKLQRAGLRSRDARIVYLLTKLAGPFGFGLLAFMAIQGGLMGELSPLSRLLVTVLSVGAGFQAPDIYLANIAAKRRQALQKSLPDGLDLLVVCAEAGLSLDAALNHVAEEIGSSSPELADELALTAVELNFLPDRRQALLNLSRRIDLPAILGVVNTLIQTEKYGTPLAQSLKVLSAEFREQRMLRAEEKAARLPATLTVPMIVFILPTLFIVLIGPAIIDVYDNIIR